jgi:hypothetical protein
MDERSNAYAELGGGLGTAFARPPRPARVPQPDPPVHVHRFHPESGWCGCGCRDDGSLAEGSPAWRAARRGRAA